MEGNNSLSRRIWNGNIYDNVSVILYNKVIENNDSTRLLLVEQNGLLQLPRKELSIREGRGPVAAAEGANNEVSHNVSSPRSSSSTALWPKDISFSEAAEDLARKITDSHGTSMLSSAKLVLLTRIYVPTLRKSYQHLVFAVHIHADLLKKMKTVDGYKILTFEEVSSLPKTVFERRDVVMVAEYLKCQLDGTNDFMGAYVREYGPHLIWKEVDEEQMVPDDFLLRSPGYREQDIEILFEEFVRLSYPHASVCLRDIKSLLTDLGFKDKEELIFRAMDRMRIGELGYKEFILGLAALDPLTSHGKGPAEIRCRYIFKYYDTNLDDVLEFSEVKEMVQDITQLQGLELTPEAITEKTKNAFEIFGAQESSGLPLANFLIAVGNLRFRGTSLLFRASTSILQHIIHKLGNSSRKRQSGSPFRSPEPSEFLHKKLRKSGLGCDSNGLFKPDNMDQDVKSLGSCSSGSLPVSQGAFQSPDSSSYTLAQHTVKVRRSGQIIDIHLLLDMERAGEVCDTGLDIDEAMSSDSTGTPFSRRGSHLIPCETNATRNRLFDRFQSVEAFNTKSLPNEMISALRFFEHENSRKPGFDWGEVDLAKLGQYIITLCAATKELMDNEPRLLWISTPCYILGDIHGNYRDLVCFEKALWRVGPHLTPANFLFLGDYVDRGDYGVEVVSYLFAQKLQAPHSFFLLRGNHEVREIQQMFTFHKECLKKFGDSLGTKVWNAVNSVFDCMPIAAVVDKKIFCIHGGIPKLDGTLKDLEKIPCPLPNPETECCLAWQMMWNDPVAAEDMNEAVQQELIDNQGFAFNEKRQTAYVFNQAAFDDFVKRNNLTHVVRAHEVKQVGFEIQQSGRLMTVFSSSHYCGGSNEAACILVHNYRMRMIRIDTS